MAQKKQVSKPQGFTHGLVSDPDPRFQIKGSYTDALNIRLTNDTGDTFTVENIKAFQFCKSLSRLCVRRIHFSP